MRIVVDAMGGDFAPKAPIEGALLYSKELGKKDEIVLIGIQSQIEEELKKQSRNLKENISIIHTPEVIEMHDQPTQAIRKKKESSIVKGISLIKEGNADAFVSAGSTGAQMAASLLTLGRLEGVNRPALGAT